LDASGRHSLHWKRAGPYPGVTCALSRALSLSSVSQGIRGGQLPITLSDPGRHGIVNGGHTFAAIGIAIKNAEEIELKSLSRAYVRLHILQGIEDSKVAEIAEGLNRSKQVDDPFLANLQGHFDRIREVMEGKPGADAIAHHQGGTGEIYISELLVFLEMFNRERFDRKSIGTIYIAGLRAPWIFTKKTWTLDRPRWMS
jgi:hypothetical protein